MSNSNPVSSCGHSCCWAAQRSHQQQEHRQELSPWTSDRITADAPPLVEDVFCGEKRSSKKNGSYKHVPHRDKPPQVVAKRNARERRRVQAVNMAFVRLRRAVPVENSRGKRISKVKTLKNAIEYIQKLEDVLRMDGYCQTYNSTMNYSQCEDRFFEFEEDF